MHYVNSSIIIIDMSDLEKINLSDLDGINPALTRYGRQEPAPVLPLRELEDLLKLLVIDMQKRNYLNLRYGYVKLGLKFIILMKTNQISFGKIQ